MREFAGVWITDKEFEKLKPRNVFHRQYEPMDLPCDEHRNRHILFRKKFTLFEKPRTAILYITADDYYKLYVNGRFVTQGPAPAYPSAYGYNTVDVEEFLQEGENVIAVHTLYQGLINRVWVSGDQRHGLLCELEADGKVIVKSDESFLTHPHTGYREMGVVGIQTQFMEEYDSSSQEVGFEQFCYDDSYWKQAVVKQHTDYVLKEQETNSLVFETILPSKIRRQGNTLFVDFGKCYVGYLEATACGRLGENILVHCGQELNEDDSVRYDMRCACKYEERWLLSGNQDKLDWFDYKSFRYAELVLPKDCEVQEISLRARHYSFALQVDMKKEYEIIPELQSIWELCVHSQKYGVQEVIQDCMDREKGFYLGDGCYTALANMVLTGDDSLVRKLIDDYFESTFITPTGVTCLDCSFMQEIAEYPFYLASLIFWHYRLTGARCYLKKNFTAFCHVLDAYRKDYEKDYLLQNMDKWCVVEWPKNYQDGYDVDLTEGKVCHEPHVALSAFYIEAIRCTNLMAKELDLPAYREEEPLLDAFHQAFRDADRHLYKDSVMSEHISYIGNVYTYAFRLYKDDNDRKQMEHMIENRGIKEVSFFGAFPLLCGLVRHERQDLLLRFLLDEHAWLRMLREGATSLFEGWGKDAKRNTSLFHLVFSYVVLFLADIDVGDLLK